MTSRVREGFELHVRRLPDGQRQLLQDLSVRVARDSTITVPSGFETNYSSIPTPFQWVVRWSRVDIAGVVHDYLYEHAAGTRRFADGVWRELAVSGAHHANRYQAWLCWLILRGVGGWFWRADKNRDHRMGWLAAAIALPGLILAIVAVLAVAVGALAIVGGTLLFPIAGIQAAAASTIRKYRDWRAARSSPVVEDDN